MTKIWEVSIANNECDRSINDQNIKNVINKPVNLIICISSN